MANRVTRASNANAHPGIVDRPSQRRSKQEVETAKKEKAEAKAQAERQKAANIQRVVEMESAAKQKKRYMEQEANDPVDKLSQPRAKRTRVQRDIINEEDDKETLSPHAVKKSRNGAAGTSAATSQKNLRLDSEESSASDLGTRVDDLQVTGEQTDDDPKSAMHLPESEESGSEYKGGSDEGPESESESEDAQLATGYEGPELEDEEPDTKIQLKTGKKQKKGLVARDQISAAVAAINDESSPRLVQEPGRVAATSGSKSRQPPGPGASKRGKTSHAKPSGGLVPNWQNVKRIQPQVSGTPTVLSRKRSGLSASSEIDSDSITVKTPSRHTSTGSQRETSCRATSSGEIDSSADAVSYRYGGFAPDDDGLVERQDVKVEGFEEKRRSTAPLRYKSITKIQEIHSTPSPRALTNNKSNKKEISYENLPQGTKNRFKKNIIPLALDTTGALKPWSTPSDEAIIEVWNLVFGDEHPIDEGDIECRRFVVAKTLERYHHFSIMNVPFKLRSRSCENFQSPSFGLIKRAISSWIHKFADTAEKALITEFTRQGLQTTEERATFVQHLLGNAGDTSDKKRPFIWESAYDEPSARKEGIFQGRLVARTLFEHIQIINTVDPGYRVQEKPAADPVLTFDVGQVHRALLYSVTGTLQPPTDKKSAEFSKNNWGDYSFVTPRGEKVVKRASVFLSKISTLKEQQWDDIFKKALAFQGTLGKQRTAVREMQGSEPAEEVDDSESDDDELLDPRYDSDCVPVEEAM